VHQYICFMKPAEINLKWAALQERIATDFDNEKPDIKVLLFPDRRAGAWAKGRVNLAKGKKKS
jgi:hypothetical protein